MEAFLELIHSINPWSAAIRICLAVLFGGIIGFERGLHGRTAGLRTHILVCLGSTLTALVGLYSVQSLGLSGDPLRVGAQVISGIGFLGVGTIILRNREHAKGLTTAAGLWATACMGLTIGIGFYTAAIVSFVMIMVTISIFFHIDRKIKKHHPAFRCYAEISDINAVSTLQSDISPLTKQIELIPARSGLKPNVGLEFRTDNQQKYASILSVLESSENVILVLPIPGDEL